MPRKPIKFDLDFMKKDIFSRFTVKQFDDVTFTITPKMDNEPYNVDNMTGIIYVGVNGEMFKQDTNITVSTNSIVITLDKNILNQNGRVYAEIELTDSIGTVTSSSFIFDIDKKIGEGATIPGGIDGFVEKYKKLTEEFKKQFQTYTTDLDNRFNTLTSEQQQDSEVIDARKGEISLRKKIDKIDEQFNTIKQQINTRIFKPKMSNMIITAHTYETGDKLKERTEILKQIKNAKEHNFDELQLILHLRQINQDLIIGGGDNFTNMDYVFEQANLYNMNINTLKIHVEGDKSSVNLDLYKQKVLYIANHFKSLGITNLIFMNEFPSCYNNSTNTQYVLDLNTQIQALGFKTSISCTDFTEFVELPNTIKSSLDFLSLNCYPFISTKGVKTTVDESVDKISQSSIINFSKYCNLNYPSKPIWITETGVKDIEGALVVGWQWNFPNNSTHDGKVQYIFLKGLYESLKNSNIEKINLWWEWDSELTKNLSKEYLGGVISE